MYTSSIHSNKKLCENDVISAELMHKWSRILKIKMVTSFWKITERIPGIKKNNSYLRLCAPYPRPNET